MALYRCFSINIFMGALRPQRRKNGFCCRGLDAGSDLQPALSCWLLCPALHTHARLLQPISRQHKVSNVLVYTSPQCPRPPARNGGGSQEKGGPTSLHQFVQWVCNLQPTACPNVLELHSKAILHGTGLQRHQAVTVAAGVTASTQHPCKEKYSIANKPSLFNS